jgi:2-polyprenyl-3-methyl-5-hydroxy-6-metoxy-1,4-benzoquinol methylase
MPYQFDHQWHEERARLAALESAFDPWSKRSILATDPQPGWRCLEIGGGGGSIAEWLCEVVGPQGEVVATDVETKFLEAIEADNLLVQTHDIARDPLEQEAFDLIHIRAVLAHLPQRDDIVRRLVSALRPGGWLVPVVTDFSSVRAVQAAEPDAAFFDKTFATVIDAARVTGFDPHYGRRIGTILRGHRLRNVHVEGVVFEWDAGHPLAALYQMTFVRLRDLVVGNGTLSEEHFARLQNIMRLPDFHAMSNTLFLARGQRAAA